MPVSNPKDKEISALKRKLREVRKENADLKRAVAQEQKRADENSRSALARQVQVLQSAISRKTGER